MYRACFHWIHITSSRAGFHQVGFYSDCQAHAVCRKVVQALQAWGWIAEIEVVDPTWIDVAYTWSWVGSQWREEALKVLEDYDIYQIGRYARWVFQGIADSIRDGLLAGATLRDAGWQ